MRRSTGWGIGAAALAIVTAGGCVTATPLITPGMQGFSLHRSSMNDIGQCGKKAGELRGGNGCESCDKNDKPASFWSAADQALIVRGKRPGEPYAPVKHGF